MIPHFKEMDNCEEQEMTKKRSVVKKTTKRVVLLVEFVKKSMNSAVSKAFSKLKDTVVLGLYDGAYKTLKDVVKKEAKRENQEQTEDKANLKPQDLRTTKEH